MRVNKGAVAELFEGFVVDPTSDPVVVDFSHTIDSAQFVSSELAVPRDVFVCSTGGFDNIPAGHVLSVASKVDRAAVYLDLDTTATAPRVFRGFLPLSSIGNRGQDV